MANYRAPLCIEGEIQSDVFQLLTDSQLAKLAFWSLQSDRSVRSLLQDARFMVEQIAEDDQLCRMIGTLPHCGLFGSLEPDGSTHT